MKIKLKVNDRTVPVERRSYDRDMVTAKHTAFADFSALVNAPGGYRPSIYLGGKTPAAQRELLFLTFEYNQHQADRHDARRVYRGDWAPVFYREWPILSEHVPVCRCPDCVDFSVTSAAVALTVVEHAVSVRPA